jgi:hypothetical protein
MTRILSVLLILSGTAFAKDAGKYYLVIRGIDEAKGVQSGVVPELTELFTAELKKHPEFTLVAPAGLPTDPEAMDEELKKRKIKALEVTLKVLEVTRAINPPKEGKQYRVLVRGIKLSVFGDTLPSKVVAIGGDGEASAGAEVGKQADLDKEGKALLLDVSRDAIKQAVDMTVNKLNLNDKPAPRLKRK